MFKTIARLFGSSKSTDTVVETAAKGIYSGLDALVFTDEEKAEMNLKVGEQIIKFADIAYDQNSIRSVTRRWLAFMVVGPTMFDVVLASIFYTIAPFVQKFENGEALFNPVQAAGGNLLSLLTLIAPWAGGVLMFYFGPHIAAAFRKKSDG